jgi:hypothetical protein
MHVRPAPVRRGRAGVGFCSANDYFFRMPRPEPIRNRPRPMAPAAPVVAADTESTLRFGPLNAVLLALGLFAILSGFSLLAAGNTVLAPLLLVLGFAVLVPLGIML